MTGQRQGQADILTSSSTDVTELGMSNFSMATTRNSTPGSGSLTDSQNQPDDPDWKVVILNNLCKDGNKLKETSTATPNGQTESNNIKIEEDKQQKPQRLIFRLTDTPPVHLLLVFALQQTLLAISTPLGTAILVAEACCAKDEEVLKTQILCSTMFMMGLSTFCMTTFGVRLPIFQGPYPGYIIPLLAMMSLEEFRCPDTIRTENSTTLMAVIDNQTYVPNYDIAISRINAYSGSLVAAGIVHFLLGAFGLAGLLGKYIGPITIVPTVTLFGISIHTVVVSFAETNWPVALLTSGTSILFSLYLGNKSTPIPLWSPKRGWHIMWYPVHQILSILIGICAGWLLSYILTECGVLSDDPTSIEFNARTDARSHIVSQTEWFKVPYPGQFGGLSFSVGAFITFLICAFLSVIDSIGDYNATAKAAYAPPPPNFAVNRGIAIEGFMSILSGFLGCGHATVSYGENIGAISLSKVASRSVFQVVGVIYMAFAVLSKVGAVFITIPHAVIGGSQIITFGILIGVVLSYLHLIDLNSTRNVSIIGTSLLLGLCVPYWAQNNAENIDLGHDDLTNLVNVALSNPSFIGAVLACFLDNTVSGTLQERGIVTDVDYCCSVDDSAGTDKHNAGEEYETGAEVYCLPVPDWLRRSAIAKFIPFFGSVKEKD